MRYHSPVTPIPLTIGQQVHLAGDPNPWTVKATTENFAALTRLDFPGFDESDEFAPSAEMLCAILDWRNGVRVAADRTRFAFTEAECAQMLAEFEAGELQVSHSNQVPIRLGEVAR